MILFVGERVHNPSLSDESVERWRAKWTKMETRTRCILSTAAMIRGPTRARLVGMIGEEPARVVNLLWPDNKIGTWNEMEAFASVMHLCEWLTKDGWIDSSAPIQKSRRKVQAIAILGRRAASAFMIDAQEPTMLSVFDAGVPAIVLPHPSGRSRYLNDPASRGRVRTAWDSFKKEFAS